MPSGWRSSQSVTAPSATSARSVCFIFGTDGTSGTGPRKPPEARPSRQLAEFAREMVTKVFSDRYCCPSMGTSTKKKPSERLRAPRTSAAVVQLPPCRNSSVMLQLRPRRAPSLSEGWNGVGWTGWVGKCMGCGYLKIGVGGAFTGQ